MRTLCPARKIWPTRIICPARIIWFSLLLSLLPLSPSPAEDTTVIATFGDSLFAGLGVGPEDSIAGQLEHRLKSDGYNVNLINFGISGDTSAGGAGRIGFVTAHKPDIILVEFGGNDMLNGMKPQDTRANLERILLPIHQAGIKMLVIGEKAPLSYGKAYAQAFDPLFCELAKKYDAPCYPFFLKAAFGKPSLMLPDGIHPNVQGAKAIADDIYPLVVKLMKK